LARGHHDLGGPPGAGPVDRIEPVFSDWQIAADAVNQADVDREWQKVGDPEAQAD